MASPLVKTEDFSEIAAQDISIVSESSIGYKFKIPPLFEHGFFRLCEGTLNGQTGDCKAICLKCTSRRELSGSIKVTSNFIKHLKRTHIEEYEDYQAKLKSKHPTLKRRTPVQRTSEQLVIYGPPKMGMALQPEVDNLILDCIVNCNLPMSVAEQNSFRTMISRLSGGATEAPNRTTLARLLGTRVEKQRTYLKATFAETNYVATTADVWQTHGMNFLWVTVHWIDGFSLVRHSSPLHCERVTDMAVIGNKLKAIYMNHGLDVSKVTRTTTDSLTNFVNAFRKIGIDCHLSNFFDDYGNIDFGGLAGCEDDDEREKIEYPPREQCPSLVLSLIATTDLDNAIVNFPVAHQHLLERTFAKLNALWNFQKRSDTGEVIKNALGKQLILPSSAMWNSLLDSLQCVLKNDRQKINEAMETLSIPGMTMSEFDFLEEYKEVLEPIATALEKIEDEDARYGHIIPIIRQTYKQLRSIKADELVFCKPIVNCLVAGMEKRFGNEIAQNDAVNDKLIATVTHPFFKMRPIIKEQRQRIRDIVLNLARKEDGDNSSINSQSPPKKRKTDYYEFSDDDEEVDDERSYLEVHQYLQDVDTSLNMLHRYPIIKRLHIQYNSGLPSSTPVKRLFSFVSANLQAARSFDDNFERLLMLKQCFRFHRMQVDKYLIGGYNLAHRKENQIDSLVQNGCTTTSARNHTAHDKK